MATPVSNNVPLIGDGRVDGLVQGSSWTFGGGPRTLTYSFTTAFDIEGEAAPAWDNRWTSAVTNAFNTWAAVANIRFSRVEGIGTGPQNESTADIAISLEPGDFGLAGLGVFPSPAFGSELLDALGYSRNSGEFPYPRIEGDIAYFPQATGFAGGAIFNVNGTLDKLQAGGMGFAILMHEIAHALGLKHAFDDGGNGRPTFDGLGLPAGFQYTLMGGESYEADPNSKIFPATPMLYDILAIQRIYGANNSYNTGDSTYQLFNDTVYRLIWDAGGTDTLTAAALSAAMTINLNAGEFSGPTSDWTKRVGTAFNVSIENATGGSGSDTITGNALANVLQGGGGDDTLRGGGGNDTLHGGAGSNTLEGGDGNDTYVLATGSANEVVEGAGAGSGIDTVQAPMHYVMTPNVENLTLTGSDNVNGYGNELDNVLTGNSGVNTLAGGPGNDSYLVQSAADVVVEEPGGGTDTILVAFTYTLAAANVENLTLTGVANVNGTGNAFDNVITGNAGNNVLDGTGGTDTLAGGAGNDTYLLNDADPGTRLEIRGTTGSVFFFSLLAPPDSVSITASDSPSDGDTLVDTVAVNVNTAAPGQFANVVFSTRNLNEPLLEGLYTNAARWPFEGMQPGMQVFANGAGFNTLTGSFDVHAAEFDYSGPSPQVVSLSIDFDQLGDGGSHWTGGLRINIVSDSPVDTVVENANEGIDTIETPFGHTLPANVENLTLTGADDVDGTGNEIANVLAGNSGVNVLAGGAGNDTYVVQDANDEVVEQPNEGSDTIAAAFSITTLPANVENATLTGSANLDVTGNAGANVLTGNAGNNTLTGGAGNDTLNGDAGFDTAIYAGNRADYTLTFSRASGTITVGTAAEGLDTLAGVEVIQFADMAVVFDLNPAVSGRTDFNDNFSGDIVWRNANGALTQWLMNGASFGSEGEPLPGIGPGWTVLGTTDFQGDGKTDIALRHADGRLFFWLMNGA
ncbi:MAG: M10 family metallopeptidase C-terminal domain-containing protein, partial [Burkholderiales bacterium]|nr:M10 family metallopeptidase C-terminal domain-containing protein [Burkholderiales bacterium]